MSSLTGLRRQVLASYFTRIPTAGAVGFIMPLLRNSADWKKSELFLPPTQRWVTRFYGHTFFVTELAFTPNDKSLVSTSWDGTVKFWYVANHQLALTLSHDDGPVNAVSFSPDGNFMATSGADGTVRL